jgi:glycosyltransferase involved in cell wall biosynthesis
MNRVAKMRPWIVEEFEIFCRTGLITHIFVDEMHWDEIQSLFSRQENDPCRPIVAPLAKIRDHEESLHGSLVVVADSELESVAQHFMRFGFARIPFLFVENATQADLISLVSRATSLSVRHVVSDRGMNYRRTGSYSAFDVSIIVPIYKVSDYVERCAQSLVNQDFVGRMEVIFVDDGSPDNSGEIVRRTIGDREGFRIITKNNGGAASARNVGIDAATGTFIGFVDGDDYVSTKYADTLFRIAVLNDCEIAQASFAYENEVTGRIDIHGEKYPTRVGQMLPEAHPSFAMMRQVPGIWRRLYSRKMLSANHLKFVEKFRQHDDLAFNIEVLSQDVSIAVTRECVYYYRVERDGQSISANDRRLFIHFDIFDYLFGKLRTKLGESEFYRTFFATMFSHHLWVFEKLAPDLRGEYLERMSRQIFKTRGPMGLFGRTIFLLSHFRHRRGVIIRAALLSAIK